MNPTQLAFLLFLFLQGSVGFGIEIGQGLLESGEFRQSCFERQSSFAGASEADLNFSLDQGCLFGTDDPAKKTPL